MKDNHVFGLYFCGHEISPYGRENGYVDYRTLSESFDCVLANNIMKAFPEYWEPYNGSDYDEENDCYHDIFQFFVISRSGADILTQYTDEIVYYNEILDMYVWGVTHCGTAWDYVLTDIKCEIDRKKQKMEDE